MLTWTERILSVSVRTAAVAEFLRELSLKGWGDLNGLLATLNDGELCREALDYWLDNEWIVRAPNSALTALVGPAYFRDLTVERFCGLEPGAGEQGEDTADGSRAPRVVVTDESVGTVESEEESDENP